jgi:hypothetical protein
MLGKEYKIKCLRKQKDFITEQLKAAANSREGNPWYTYQGDIFPEVIDYIKNQGYTVNIIEEGTFKESRLEGLPIYIISNASIELTPEEIKLAFSGDISTEIPADSWGKKVKILSMFIQLEFIKRQLKLVSLRSDGDTSYKFFGQLYPEVIKYFEDEGYVITAKNCIINDKIIPNLNNYFFSNAAVELSSEEMEQALNYSYESSEEEVREEAENELIGMLMGAMKDACGHSGMGGSPFGMGGSPFGMGGSPFGMGGSPLGMGDIPFGMGGSPFGMSGGPFGKYGFGGSPKEEDESEEDD